MAPGTPAAGPLATAGPPSITWQHLGGIDLPLVQIRGVECIPLQTFSLSLGVAASRLLHAARSLQTSQVGRETAVARADLARLVSGLRPGLHNKLLILSAAAEHIAAGQPQSGSELRLATQRQQMAALKETEGQRSQDTPEPRPALPHGGGGRAVRLDADTLLAIRRAATAGASPKDLSVRYQTKNYIVALIISGKYATSAMRQALSVEHGPETAPQAL